MLSQLKRFPTFRRVLFPYAAYVEDGESRSIREGYLVYLNALQVVMAVRVIILGSILAYVYFHLENPSYKLWTLEAAIMYMALESGDFLWKYKKARAMARR